MYITIEGIDGSGKSTLIKNLAQHYQDWVLVHEPGTTELSLKLREIILHAQDDNLDFRTQLLLMYAARSDLFSKIINPKLKEGYTVLADRSNISSFAYQLYPIQKNASDNSTKLGYDILDFWSSLNTFSQSKCSPDIVIYLRLKHSELGLTRTSSIKSNDNLTEKGIDYFHLVAEGYDKIFDYIMTAGNKIKTNDAPAAEGYDLIEIIQNQSDSNRTRFIAVIDGEKSEDEVLSLSQQTIEFVTQLLEEREKERKAIEAAEVCALESALEISSD